MGRSIQIFFSFFLLILLAGNAQAIKFSIGGKKAQPANESMDTNYKDDKDYIDRSELDLGKLKSKEITTDGVVDDVGVYRIKSVLQDHGAVYKVNHEGFDQYYIYFHKGKNLSNQQISTLVKGVGFKV